MRIDLAYTATPFAPVDFAACLPGGTPCDEAATARQAVEDHLEASPYQGDGAPPRGGLPLMSAWSKEHERLKAVATAKEKACAEYQKQKAKQD